jgi:hypothetical protein
LPVSHTHITILISFVSIAFTLCFLAIAMTTDSLTLQNHVGHLTKNSKFDSVQISHVEHLPDLVRQGDAKIPSRFLINSEFVDPDNNCDFCTMVNYTPSMKHEAAIAYKTENIDLTNSKRIVFFAMGQKGRETISFLAAGKSEAPTVGANSNQSFIFPGISFAVIAHNITLSKDWKRYEISLYDADLRNITYPFGFAIEPKSSGSLAFYLKGVTFDDKFASNPIL